MSAITTSADGAYIFLALEDGDGYPIIARAARADLSVWTAAYQPGAGSAANVVPVPGNPDLLLFYGHFGSGAQVIKHTISSGANVNISPDGLAAKIVNTLAVNPSDPAEIVVTVDTDQDILYSDDGGTTWTAWDDALGLDATALYVLWSGNYDYHRYFLAGLLTGAPALVYSPNEGYSSGDYTGTPLAAAAGLVSIDIAESLA